MEKEKLAKYKEEFEGDSSHENEKRKLQRSEHRNENQDKPLTKKAITENRVDRNTGKEPN